MRRTLLKFLVLLLILAVLFLVLLRLAAVQRESENQSSAPTRGTMIQTQSLSFYTLSSGPTEGQPVLLAHGSAAWSGFWEKEVTELGEAGYRAIAFDMPSFGYSDRPPDGDYSRAAQAKRILDLVGTLDTPPVMIAHSFGAAAATEAVLLDPKAFAGLIIVNGALAMDAEATQSALPLPIRNRTLRETAIAASVTNPLATKFLLRGLLYNRDSATDQIVDVLQTPQLREGTTESYADWLTALMAPAPDTLSRDPASYANLSIPVRIIWGDKDTVTPPAQAEAIADALGQSEVAYLRNVGHIPHIEAPEAFEDLLLSLLAEITHAR